MKETKLLRPFSFLAAAAALCAVGTASATTTNYVMFGTTNDVTFWWQGWGATATIVQDSVNGVDANGALSIHADFTTGNDFAVFYTTGGPWTLTGFAYRTNYCGVQFDIRWDPASTMPNDTNYGLLTGSTQGASWSGSDSCDFIVPPNWSDYTPGVTNTQDAGKLVYFSTIAGKPGWYHFWHYWPATYSISQIGGFEIENYEGNASGPASIKGPAGYYLSHVEFISNSAPPPQPPTLSIFKAKSGLNLISTVGGNNGARENIRVFGGPTQDQLFYNSFSGLSGQTITSFTIKDFPGTNYAGHQLHLFFVPISIGGGTPGTETAPDWNEANVACLRLVNNADGTMSADFSYKVNSLGGYDGTLFLPAGTLGAISSPTLTGTWTFAVHNDEANNALFTLTAPGGASTNFTMPAGIASSFSSPMYTYFGTQPRFDANIGQTVVLSHVLITNTVNGLVVDDNFQAEALDPNNWDLDATTGNSVVADAGGVVLVPPDAPVWVSWTLPDTGFFLATTNLLTAPAATWIPATAITNYVFGTNRHSLIINSQLGFTNDLSFFRMVKTN